MAANDYRFDVRTQTGVDFPSMTLKQLQPLVDDGTLQRDDSVKVCSDPQQRWFTLDRVDGLVFTNSSNSAWIDHAPTPQKGPGAQTAVLAGLLGVFVLLVLTAGLIGYRYFFGSGTQPVVQETPAPSLVEAPTGDGAESTAAVEEIDALILLADQLAENGDLERAEEEVNRGSVLAEEQRAALGSSEYSRLESRIQILRERIRSARVPTQVAQEPPTTKPTEVSIDDWMSQHERAVPILISMTDDGVDGGGTGFLISWADRWYLATNRHVIDGSSVPGQTIHPAPTQTLAWHFSRAQDGSGGMEDVYNFDQQPFSPAAFKVHREGVDVAVADVTEFKEQLSEQGIRPLTLVERGELPEGAPLFWVGHPGSGSWPRLDDRDGWEEFFRQTRDLLKVTQGELSIAKRQHLGYGDRHWEGAETYVIITTGAINQGNSGGPMLRRSDGKVVGICSAAGTMKGGERNIAVRARHIVETIEEGNRWDPIGMGPKNVGVAEYGLPRRNDCDEISAMADAGVLPPRFGEVAQLVYESGGRRLFCMDFDSLASKHGKRSGADVPFKVNINLEMELKKRGFEKTAGSHIYVIAVPHKETDLDMRMLDSKGQELDYIIPENELVDDEEDMVAYVHGWRKTKPQKVSSLDVINNGDRRTRFLLVVYGRE